MTLRSDWTENAIDDSKGDLRGSPFGSPMAISRATLANKTL
jgi:hypothetical protein